MKINWQKRRNKALFLGHMIICEENRKEWTEVTGQIM